MKLPQAPPPFDWQKAANLLAAKPELFERLAATGDHYLHWDELRHREPPPGLTHDDWWSAIAMQRRMASPIRLPLATPKDERFWFVLTGKTQRRLMEIDRAAAGFIAAPDGMVNKDTRERFLFNSLVEEAITSSQLEGAATTRAAAKEMIRTHRPPADTGERMILNNYRTMERVRAIADRDLSMETLLELHRELTAGTLDDPGAAGRLRHKGEEVRVVDVVDGDVFYTPPPADRLPQRLALLIDFANGRPVQPFIHPALRAIVLHFWLAYEHPFVDGNGRCARALFYWSMLRGGYWLCEFISISSILKRAKAAYARSFLYTETDHNDLTYFTHYQLDVVKRSLDGLARYIDRKNRQAAETEALLRNAEGYNYRQIALLSYALRHPNARFTIQSHQTSHRIVYETARNDLDTLVRRGLLNKKKRGRQFVFEPVADFERVLQTSGKDEAK